MNDSKDLTSIISRTGASPQKRPADRIDPGRLLQRAWGNNWLSILGRRASRSAPGYFISRFQRDEFLADREN
jgi:hypothetical protein